MFSVHCVRKCIYACILDAGLCLHCKLCVCVFWVGGGSVHWFSGVICCFGVFPFGSRPSLFALAYSEWLYQTTTAEVSLQMWIQSVDHSGSSQHWQRWAFHLFAILAA